MFALRGSATIRDLLKETRFIDYADSIDVQDIESSLARKPDLVPDWIQYSEDKRTTNGYYISHEENEPYVVGYYALKSKSRIIGRYTDHIKACAVFVHLELNDIASRIGPKRA